MKLEEWALIAEIVSEVQQNTVAQKASIYQTMSHDVRAITSSLPYQTRMKLRQGEAPTRLEEVEYINWSASTMRIYESWWKQHQLKTIDDETFRSYISHMHLSLADRYMRDWWLHKKGYEALPGFEAYVAEYIAGHPLEDQEAT